MTIRNQILDDLKGLSKNTAKINESVNNDKEWQDFEKVVKADPSNKKLKQVCTKYGYDCDYAYKTSFGYIRFNVYPKDRSNSSYYPDVYRNDIANGLEFKIGTVSYGSLSEVEYAKFLKACDAAYNLAHVLNNFDWDKLPVAPEE